MKLISGRVFAVKAMACLSLTRSAFTLIIRIITGHVPPILANKQKSKNLHPSLVQLIKRKQGIQGKIPMRIKHAPAHPEDMENGIESCLRIQDAFRT